MSSHDDLHAAIAALHAAGLGDTTWEQALDHVLRLTGFAGAAMWWLQSVARFPAGRAIWYRLDTSGKDDYVNYYAAIDPSVPLLRDPVKNRIRYDYLALSEAEIDRDEYYAWHEAASCGMRYRVAGVTRPDLPFHANLSLHRPKSHGHATDAEVERFRLLFGHIERALEVEYRLHLERGISVGLASAVAASDTGCVILDHLGRPVFANDVARRLADGAFSLGRDGIAVHGKEADRALRALIAACLATALGSGTASGGDVRLPRTALGGIARRDLLATVSPVPSVDGGPRWNGASVCVLIVDPELERAPDETLIRQLYHLTPAEAALAARLATGSTLREAAAARGIAFTTARSYLEQIFHRTGTRRQVELVRLLLAVAAWPRPLG